MSDKSPVLTNRIEDKMVSAARKLSYNGSIAEAEAKFRLIEGAGEIRALRKKLSGRKGESLEQLLND